MVDISNVNISIFIIHYTSLYLTNLHHMHIYIYTYIHTYTPLAYTPLLQQQLLLPICIYTLTFSLPLLQPSHTAE